jgi:hypothetical protein
MELSLNLVYNKKLITLGTTGTFPQDNNCYRCEVIDIETDTVDYIADYVPIPVYDMWIYLSSNKNRFTKIDMLNIIRPFNDYGDWKYLEADYDNSFNTEDI